MLRYLMSIQPTPSVSSAAFSPAFPRPMKIVLALEGGYNSVAVAESVKACVETLSNFPVNFKARNHTESTLPSSSPSSFQTLSSHFVHISPFVSPMARTAISECIKVQRNFYPVLHDELDPSLFASLWPLSTTLDEMQTPTLSIIPKRDAPVSNLSSFQFFWLLKQTQQCLLSSLTTPRGSSTDVFLSPTSSMEKNSSVHSVSSSSEDSLVIAVNVLQNALKRAVLVASGNLASNSNVILSALSSAFYFRQQLGLSKNSTHFGTKSLGTLLNPFGVSRRRCLPEHITPVLDEKCQVGWIFSSRQTLYISSTSPHTSLQQKEGLSSCQTAQISPSIILSRDVRRVENGEGKNPRRPRMKLLRTIGDVISELECDIIAWVVSVVISTASKNPRLNGTTAEASVDDMLSMISHLVELCHRDSAVTSVLSNVILIKPLTHMQFLFLQFLLYHAIHELLHHQLQQLHRH